MWDIKLTDGRYLKNVDVWCQDDVVESKEYILETEYTMDIFREGEECDNIAFGITNNDIEYICKCYKDTEV